MKSRQQLLILMVFTMGIGLGTMGLGGPWFNMGLSTAMASEPPATVLIVQHAERHEYTKEDPDPELTAEGKQRAQDLVHAVGNAGIVAIFSPKARRMVQTVQPLQQSLNLPQLHGYEPGNLNSMLAGIGNQYKGKVVLLVGPGSHMGAGGIREIAKDLGCTGPECEFKDSNDNLIVVTILAPGKASAVKLRYGKPVKP